MEIGEKMPGPRIAGAGIRSSRDDRAVRTPGGRGPVGGVVAVGWNREVATRGPIFAGRELQGRQGCSLAAQMDGRNPIEQEMVGMSARQESRGQQGGIITAERFTCLSL